MDKREVEEREGVSVCEVLADGETLEGVVVCGEEVGEGEWRVMRGVEEGRELHGEMIDEVCECGVVVVERLGVGVGEGEWRVMRGVGEGDE